MNLQNKIIIQQKYAETGPYILQIFGDMLEPIVYTWRFKQSKKF